MKLDAWQLLRVRLVSPPSRGRGLKCLGNRYMDAGLESPPSRGRGLKLYYGKVMVDPATVAPLAGAWIEI